MAIDFIETERGHKTGLELILVYRDGVSEGLHQKVLEEELQLLLQVCENIQLE